MIYIRDPQPDPDEMHFWCLQERGFYAEPDEIDLPTFVEARDRPELILYGQAR